MFKIITKTGFITMILAVMLTISIFMPTAYAETADNAGIKVVYNGIPVEFNEQGPIIDSLGNTLVPLSAILSLLDRQAEWNQEESSVTIKSLYKLKLYIGKNEAEIGDKKVTLDATPQVINDRTMVPLRFVADALYTKVEWDDATKTITMTDLDWNTMTLEEKFIDSWNIERQNDKVKIYIKLKNDIPEEIIDLMEMHEGLTVDAISKINNVECSCLNHGYNIDINKKDKSITITNLPIPPQIDKEQSISYKIYLQYYDEGLTNTFIDIPAFKIEAEPKATPAEIESVRFEPSEKPDCKNIVIKLTKSPDIQVSSSSFSMIRYINGIIDLPSNYPHGHSSSYEGTNTLILRDVPQPKPADKQIEVRYDIKFIPGNRVVSSSYIIPPKAQ